MTHLAAQTITGHLNKTATLTVNNTPLTVAADHSFTKNVTLSEGNNTYTFIATAPDGEGAQTLFGLVLDTQAPSAAQAGLIAVGEVINGTVSVTGAAGSVEAGARVTITNTRSGDIVMVTANGLGAFRASIAAQGSDVLSIRVSDAAGNASGNSSLPVNGSVAVHIMTPVVGTTFQTDRVTVKGRYSGSRNSGITVNSVVAMIDDAGNFMAANVPLLDGQNTITATIKTLNGQTTTETVTVNNSYVSSYLELNASPSGGPAPLDAEFTYQLSGQGLVSEARIDYEGDGTDDAIAGANAPPFQHTYTAPGLYEAKLTIVSDGGQIHRASTVIQVLSAASMDAVFSEVWNAMNGALSAGSPTQTSTFLTAAAQAKYGPVFETLLPRMNDIITSYSPLIRVSLSTDIGEYAINRLIDGRNQIFFIYFIKDEDGVWRLDAM